MKEILIFLILFHICFIISPAAVTNQTPGPDDSRDESMPFYDYEDSYESIHDSEKAKKSSETKYAESYESFYNAAKSQDSKEENISDMNESVDLDSDYVERVVQEAQKQEEEINQRKKKPKIGSYSDSKNSDHSSTNKFSLKNKPSSNHTKLKTTFDESNKTLVDIKKTLEKLEANSIESDFIVMDQTTPKRTKPYENNQHQFYRKPTAPLVKPMPINEANVKKIEIAKPQKDYLMIAYKFLEAFLSFLHILPAVVRVFKYLKILK